MAKSPLSDGLDAYEKIGIYQYSTIFERKKQDKIAAKAIIERRENAEE